MNSEADYPCVKHRDQLEDKCLSKSELERLEDKVSNHFSNGEFMEAFVNLRDLDLSSEIDLSYTRGSLYFIQDGKTVSKCDAVNDLERYAKTYPIVAGSLLDLIYSGGYMQIAAREGSVIARILLVESLQRKKKFGWDTMHKLSPELYYSDLLSMLEISSNQKLDPDLTRKVNKLKQQIVIELEEADIQVSSLAVVPIKPKKIICPIRY